MGNFEKFLPVENGNIWRFSRISVLIDEFSHFRLNLMWSVVYFVCRVYPLLVVFFWLSGVGCRVLMVDCWCRCWYGCCWFLVVGCRLSGLVVAHLSVVDGKFSAYCTVHTLWGWVNKTPVYQELL
jgi:hypothetical protein